MYKSVTNHNKDFKKLHKPSPGSSLSETNDIIPLSLRIVSSISFGLVKKINELGRDSL